MERLNRRGNGLNARVRRLRWVVSCGSALLAATVFAGEVEKKPLPLVDNALLPPLFKQGEAARRDGSKMVFFLGNFDENLTHKRPVLVYVEGSGAQSQFVRMGDRIGYMERGALELYPDLPAFMADPRTGVRGEIEFWEKLKKGDHEDGF